VIQPRVFQRFEHLVGADGTHGGATPAGDVAEGMGEKRLADPDRADQGDMGVRVEEAQRGELIEEGAIEGDLRGRVPGVEAHGRIQAGLLDTQRDGEGFAPRDFVAEDLQQEILMRHLLLARERERSGSVSSMRDSFSRRRTVLRSGLITSGVVMRIPLLQRPRWAAAVGIAWPGGDSARAE